MKQSALTTGRVRWFDTAAQCGTLADVGATTYFFERTDAELKLPSVSRGELVTFVDGGRDGLRRTATHVRPLSSRSS